MYGELKVDVMQYLDTQDKSRLNTKIFLKTFFLFIIFLASYMMTLIAYSKSMVLGLCCNFIFVITSLLLVFCMFHDASHRSIGKGKGFNYLLCSLTASFFGAASNEWLIKHVKQHHGQTNIPGNDNDIEQGFIFRLHKARKKERWHQWQHLYALPLYSLIVLKWVYVSDFFTLLTNPHKLNSSRQWALLINILIIKTIHIFFFFVIPYNITHSVGCTLLFFFFSFTLIGLVSSIIFQLAHLTGVQEFPNARYQDWAEHQLGVLSR